MRDTIAAVGPDGLLRGLLSAVAGGLLAIGLTAMPASAQFGAWSFVAVGETAGDDISLVLGEVSAFRAGTGLMPVLALQSYYVDHPGGSTWSVEPQLGARDQTTGGFLQGKVGYAFKDEAEGVSFFGGDESGISTSAHVEYWGTGAFGLQGIVAYAWGSEYYWSRARGTARVYDGLTGDVNVGAELAWQGETDDDPLIDEYNSTQYGPILQWVADRGAWIAVLGGGVKEDDFADENTWYAKLEFVLNR